MVFRVPLATLGVVCIVVQQLLQLVLVQGLLVFYVESETPILGAWRHPFGSVVLLDMAHVKISGCLLINGAEFHVLLVVVDSRLALRSLLALVYSLIYGHLGWNASKLLAHAFLI